MKKIAIVAIALSFAGASGVLAQGAPAAGSGSGGGLGGGLGLGAGVGASLAVPIGALVIGIAAVEGGRSDSTTATATSTN